MPDGKLALELPVCLSLPTSYSVTHAAETASSAPKEKPSLVSPEPACPDPQMWTCSGPREEARLHLEGRAGWEAAMGSGWRLWPTLGQGGGPANPAPHKGQQQMHRHFRRIQLETYKEKCYTRVEICCVLRYHERNCPGFKNRKHPRSDTSIRQTIRW